LPQQVPLVVVVLAAVRTGDDHALHALRAEDLANTAQILEVGADVLLLLRIEPAGLLLGWIVDRIFHQSSSSLNAKVRKASAYSTPPRAPSSRARSRTHGAEASPRCDRCRARASSFTSMVFVMSTYVSGSSEPNQRFGISNGSSPASRS